MFYVRSIVDIRASLEESEQDVDQLEVKLEKVIYFTLLFTLLVITVV